MNETVDGLFNEYYERFAGPGVQWNMVNFLEWLANEHNLVVVHSEPTS